MFPFVFLDSCALAFSPFHPHPYKFSPTLKTSIINMAVDVCCEVSSLVVSPRISFSYDLKESDRMIITPVPESHPLISTIDFDFRITTDQIFSSADELFANGKILPVELKKSTPPKPSSSSSTNEPTKRHMLKELLSLSANSEEEKPPPSKPPFWQFKRSFSLNCENGRSNNSLIRSLQFLSRSNSTGSAQNLRPPPVLPRPIQRRNSKKEPPPLATRAASSCGGHYPLRSSSKKSSSSSGSSSPLKKSRSGRAYGSLKISPVLNIPPAYISKATLFGLSSLFCNAKSKKKKK